MHSPPFAPDAALLAQVHLHAAAVLTAVRAFRVQLDEDPFAPCPPGLLDALDARRDAFAALGAHTARRWAALGASGQEGLASDAGGLPDVVAPVAVPGDAGAVEAGAAPGAVAPPAAEAPPAAPEAEAAVAAPEAEAPPAAQSPALASVAEPAAPPPAKPASLRVDPVAAAAALNQRFRGGPKPGAARAPQGAVPAPSTARTQDAVAGAIRRAAVLDDLGPFPKLDTPDSAQAALAAVLRCIAALDQWGTCSDDRREVLAAIVPRLRALQAERGAGLPQQPIDDAFRRLTAWSAEVQPGFVWGLARAHSPRHGSWRAEAEDAWAALCAPPAGPGAEKRAMRAVRDAVSGGELTPLVEAIVRARDAGVAPSDRLFLQAIEPAAADLLAGVAALPAAVRKALRKWMDDDDSTAAAESAAGRAPLDPALATWCAGKRVLVIGGEGSKHARDRLAKAFGFATLKWCRAWERKRAEALREAALSCKFDLVIFIARFVSHAMSDQLRPTLQESGLPIAMIHSGYGVPQVAAAITNVALPSPAR